MIPRMCPPITPLPVPAPGPIRFHFDEPLKCVNGRVYIRGDIAPTENSVNYLSSGTIYTALKTKVDEPTTAGTEGSVLAVGQNGTREWVAVSSVVTVSQLPQTGNAKNLYILSTANTVYRWSDQQQSFVLLSQESEFAQWLENNVDKDGKIKSANLDVAVATLTNGVVPESQLPSSVKNITEYAQREVFPERGEADKIYIAADTQKIYYWKNNQFVELSPGETGFTEWKQVNIDTNGKIKSSQLDKTFVETETDPTVPGWAKQLTKPTYTPEEIGTLSAGDINDKINQVSAHYLTWKNDEGEYVPFSSHGKSTGPRGSLAWAKAHHTEENPQFWYGTTKHTPDKNDYCVVLEDEEHKTDAGVAPTTRYSFVGEWGTLDGMFRYQYTINETPFSEGQWKAINSGITAEKIATVDQTLETLTETKLDAELKALPVYRQTLSIHDSTYVFYSPTGKLTDAHLGSIDGRLIQIGDQFSGSSQGMHPYHSTYTVYSDTEWKVDWWYSDGPGGEGESGTYFKTAEFELLSAQYYTLEQSIALHTSDKVSVDDWSKITKQDITDFSRNFGYVFPLSGDLIFARQVSQGGYFTTDFKLWYKAERAILKDEKWSDVSTEAGAVSTYNPSEGFAKLEMLGENIRNNAYWVPDQIKDALFAAGIKDVVGYPSYQRKVYAVGDIVEHNGVIYKCKTAITAAEDWTEVHWEKTNVKSQIPEVVAPASDMALRNKAADAYETGVKLDEKLDKKGGTIGGSIKTTGNVISTNYIWVEKHENNDEYVGISYDGFIEIGLPSGEEVSLRFPQNTRLGGTGTIALVSDIATHEAGGLTPSAKAALFADTAFKTKVEEIIDEHGGGEDEATQGVFAAFARMDGYTEADAKDVLDVGIEKMSQLLGENVAAYHEGE